MEGRQGERRGDTFIKIHCRLTVTPSHKKKKEEEEEEEIEMDGAVWRGWGGARWIPPSGATHPPGLIFFTPLSILSPIHPSIRYTCRQSILTYPSGTSPVSDTPLDTPLDAPLLESILSDSSQLSPILEIYGVSNSGKFVGCCGMPPRSVWILARFSGVEVEAEAENHSGRC